MLIQALTVKELNWLSLEYFRSFFPPCIGDASGIVLTVQDFPPGDFILTVTARDVSGQTATQVVEPILLSGQFAGCKLLVRARFYPSHSNTEPALSPVTCSLQQEGTTVVCSTPLEDTLVPLSYSCSYNDGPASNCESWSTRDRVRILFSASQVDLGQRYPLLWMVFQLVW